MALVLLVMKRPRRNHKALKRNTEAQSSVSCFRTLTVRVCIGSPSRGAFRLKVKGEGRIQKLEVHLKQYAKLKRDLDAGGTFNVLRERYDEAKGKLEDTC